jgi:hypothetical protein
MVLPFGFFTGCAANPSVVFDDSIPQEQTAWITTFDVGTIITYNGISVNWKDSHTLVSLTPKFIQIPAGDALLEWNIDSWDAGLSYRGKNLLVKITFEPQKKYFFRVGEDETRSGLWVYALDRDEKFTLTNKQLKRSYIGFSPFI